MWMAWQRAERAQDVKSVFPSEAAHVDIVPELAPGEDEAVFDKVTMSAFEGTPLDLVLRDCGVSAVAILGVALEIGVEPTVRHGADLGYLPILITDACGAGNLEAGRRSLASLEFAGDALPTDAAAFAAALS